jgi:hypothetical protein
LAAGFAMDTFALLFALVIAVATICYAAAIFIR